MYSCQLEFTPLHQSSFIYIKKQKKNEKNKRKKDVLSIFKKKRVRLLLNKFGGILAIVLEDFSFNSYCGNKG